MFLAVDLDDGSRHAIAAHLDASLGGRRLPGKPVPPENWHITLRFLGRAEAKQAEQILAHLDQHLVVGPHQVRVDGLGAFPREGRASVLWLGLQGDVESLSAVALECETAAQRAGFEPEGRPFHPHVTLSRIRPPVNVGELIETVPGAGVDLAVNRVTLFRSLLGGGPVRYELVDEVEL